MSNDASPCLTRLVYGDDSELLVARWSDLRRQLTHSLTALLAASERNQQMQLHQCLLDFATEHVRAARFTQPNKGVLT